MTGRALRAVVVAAAGVGLAAGPALAQGCAMCRQALEQDGGPGLVRGFYLSIVLLVSLPILMTGTFLLLLRRAARRRRAGEGRAGE